MNRVQVACATMGIVASAYFTNSFIAQYEQKKIREAKIRSQEVQNEILVEPDQQQQPEKEFEGESESSQQRMPSSVNLEDSLFLNSGELNPAAFQIADHYIEISAALEKGWINENEVAEYKTYLEFILQHDEDEMMEVYGDNEFEGQDDFGGERYEN
ncbi:MAG: hypothetical protein AAF202_01365 [Pseudomonadota bacterium]